MLGNVKSEEILSGDWDFVGADTQYLTHGLHPYPARMVPQIAHRLLKMYAQKNDVVLDPFCGSGGVLVEARLAGLNSVGIDINPLACLLAEVKSNPIDPSILISWWEELRPKIKREIGSLKNKEIDAELAKLHIKGLRHWFKEKTIKELAVIRRHIRAMDDRSVRRFFAVPFSLTVRDVSGTRKDEYKLYRRPEDEWSRFQPDVLATFARHVERSIRKMAEFYRVADKNVFSRVFLGDTRLLFTNRFPEEGNRLLREHPPKIVITSPPYGDSRTTVAYGQFSRLPSLWLGFEPEFTMEAVMNVDRLSLGGEPVKLSGNDCETPTLAETIEKVRSKDEERAEEVLAYFADLYTCIKKIHDALDDGGYCCIVIANRTVRRVVIPTHEIILEMGAKVGFERVAVIPRNIPTKRLPWENAPENIPGMKGKTMSQEHIIVMRKI
jgi:SAM-dependent methyltransferase